MSEGESPLGQALQRLALMQESTTALQRQQCEALLEIASSQQEEHALLRELLPRPATREVEPVTSPARPPLIALQKMTAKDYSEHLEKEKELLEERAKKNVESLKKLLSINGDLTSKKGDREAALHLLLEPQIREEVSSEFIQLKMEKGWVE
ncbi:hypothetical protein NQZ68_014166 [Dissostichus eleginoides]|nr:hypothetical protein NQZ68_014166 [Dissostichus eleginoides]